MCGIHGQVTYNTGIEENSLRQMLNSTDHRGRDDADIFIDKNLGFAHNRLAIVDLSDRGKQPMLCLESRFVIIFNGEIFNARELKKKLAAKGHTFITETDTEVLLKLWIEYQEKLLGLVDGMFAFAIWDRLQKSLFLARDQVGVKPLYYASTSKGIIFSSEIKAILASGWVDARISPEGLKDYLYMQTYAEDHTLFRNINSLPPGQFLTFREQDRKIKIEKYFDFHFFEEKKQKLKYSDVVSELSHRIVSSVNDWCYSDVPIAAYVSGGLDSSMVASIASSFIKENTNQKKLITFSSVFSGFVQEDEKKYSDMVAHYIKSNHHSVELNIDEIVKDHNSLMYTLDMPCAGYSAPYQTLSRMVRKHAKVVLTGHGGDELFMGYPKYYAVYLAQQIYESYAGKRRSMNLEGMYFIKGFEKQIKMLLSQICFSDDKAVIQSVFNRSGHLLQYLNPDIEKECTDYNPVDALLEMAPKNAKTLEKILYLDRKVLLPALLHVEDRTSMAENLESRTPFLSKHVLDFLPSIPYEFYFKKGLKGLVRDVAKKYLPREVVSNPKKSGTLFPIHEIFSNKCKPIINESLNTLDQSGIFQKSSSEILLAQPAAQQVDRTLWALWSLGSWLSSFKIN